jgi:endonuclease III
VKAPAKLPEIARKLRSRYADFDHFNKRNPLDELIFIICSVQTTEVSYKRTFRALRDEFRTFEHLNEAPAEYLARPLKAGGLSAQKSKSLRTIFDSITETFGKLSLSPLKDYPNAECETFLTSLPGVGKKVARCVMMYSLGRQVFPVDTHCWRIARRLGWIRSSSSDGHCSNRDMDRLQDKIDPEWRFSLHVNFISLGRDFCTAIKPDCSACPISEHCRKVGVKKLSYR